MNKKTNNSNFTFTNDMYNTLLKRIEKLEKDNENLAKEVLWLKTKCKNIKE